MHWDFRQLVNGGNFPRFRSVRQITIGQNDDRHHVLDCNPASFERDAAILAGGGFRLARLAAFDQFQQPLAATVAWSISSGPGSINSAGLYTAPATAVGTTVIKANTTLNGVTLSRTATVTLVAPPLLTAISASPSTVTGTTTTLTVTGHNPAGGALTYSWYVLTQPAGARVPTWTTRC